MLKFLFPVQLICCFVVRSFVFFFIVCFRSRFWMPHLCTIASYIQPISEADIQKTSWPPCGPHRASRWHGLAVCRCPSILRETEQSTKTSPESTKRGPLGLNIGDNGGRPRVKVISVHCFSCFSQEIQRTNISSFVLIRAVGFLKRNYLLKF
jgi:hypothetical protein